MGAQNHLEFTQYLERDWTESIVVWLLFMAGIGNAEEQSTFSSLQKAECVCDGQILSLKFVKVSALPAA